MAEEGFKRKLTAILSADVAGYSRLMEVIEEECRIYGMIRLHGKFCDNI